MAAYQNALAVVIVPFPTQGHLTPLLRLSRRISAFRIPVHFLGSETTCYQASTRSDIWNAGDATTFVFCTFPTPPFVNVSPSSESRFPTHQCPMISATLSAIRQPLLFLVTYLSWHYARVVIILDTLMTSTVKSVGVFSFRNVECYIFETASAFTIYSVYWERYGDPEIPPEAAEAMNQIPSLEDCFPPEFREFVTLQYETRDFHFGTIFNSGRSVEQPYLQLLANHPQFGNGFWAIGPLNPVYLVEGPYPVRYWESEYVRWIRHQPMKSVLLVSLGTTVSLSNRQIKQLALGLARSGVRFVWLLRDADRGNIFAGGARRIRLPPEFEQRVRNRGIVVREWVSQHEILDMINVGGFLSSCGWNSCLESISAGVPIAAWPMHSDQPRNAVLVTKVLRIGVEVRDWQFRGRLVRWNDIVSAIQRLMNSPEGAEMRERVEQLDASVERSWAPTNASSVAMDSFIQHISSF